MTLEQKFLFDSQINIHNAKDGLILKVLQRERGMFNGVDKIWLLPDQKRFLSSKHMEKYEFMTWRMQKFLENTYFVQIYYPH